MRLDSFLERVPLNVLILDNDYRVIQISKAMAEVNGVPAEGQAGKFLEEVFPSLASLVQPHLEKLQLGERVNVEMNTEPSAYPGVSRQWQASCFRFGRSEIGVVVSEITERKKLEEKLTRTQHQLETATAEIGRNSLVNEMTYSLQTCSTTEELYNIVARFGARLFPRNSGALCIIDSSKNTVEVTASWGDTSAFEPVFSPDKCWALRGGRLHVVDDPATELRCAHATANGGAQLCMPMMAQSETLGILHLYDPVVRDTEAFSRAELRLAHKVAEEIALPLANLRMREVLQHQALRDPLTGLYNRRFFSDALQRELRRAVRKNCSIGLIMLDIDFFKRFNDAHGHAAGDALLRAASHLLQSRVRAGDVLCRLGGDEFSILMPEASLEDTLVRAQELRQAFKLLNFESDGQTLGGISMSSGAAAFPIHGLTAEALLHEADAGLYLAKSSGRDQVVTTLPSSSSAAG